MIPVEYIPGLVSNPDEVFERIFHGLDFESREESPRLEYYMNDHDVPYAYGPSRHARVFHPKPWHPDILEIRKSLEERYSCVFDVCFVNCYLHHRQHLGWHADDSPEMDDARPIITVSLGAERQIWFRENDVRDPESVTKMTLENGSACTMPPGFQDSHQHRIPKHDRECGPRISLTFRGYVNPPEENNK